MKITDFGLSRIESPSGEVIYNHKNEFSSLPDNKSDIENLWMSLKKIKIIDREDIDEEMLSSYKYMLSHLRKGISTKQLLKEEVFELLKQKQNEDLEDDFSTVYTACYVSPHPLTPKKNTSVVGKKVAPRDQVTPVQRRSSRLKKANDENVEEKENQPQNRKTRKRRN